jgi:glutathione S-transferase
MALWMLEELGVPYRLETVDINKGQQKAPAYLKINPMGKVPAVTVNGTVITESPAICLYLSDRYGYGTFAPRIEDPARATYLRWMIFSTAVVEPTLTTHGTKSEISARQAGWGAYEDVLETLRQALAGKTFLLGDDFTAADVALGGQIGWGLFNKNLPEDPILVAYSERIAARPANQKAAALTWGSAA